MYEFNKIDVLILKLGNKDNDKDEMMMSDVFCQIIKLKFINGVVSH